MGWWKADPVPEPPSSSPLPPPPSHPLPTSTSSSSAAAECPVDPQTRSIWLQQAVAQQQQQQKKIQATTVLHKQQELPPSHPPINPHTLKSTTPEQCSSDRISQSASSSSESAPSNKTVRPTTKHTLSHEREISTIPRAQPPSNTTSTPTPSPSNSEQETGTSTSGHWIYPSESQFYNAVLRKQTATSSSPTELAQSMSAIIPIHNAVNERAWTLIKAWEGDSSASCGGPKLLSFKGLGAGALSPKARMKTFVGYIEPFDRHDWVVERCGGQTVEYVIDFYQGKAPDSGAAAAAGKRARQQQQQLNFYLDVRPKLNSLEGCRMRFERFIGWR
ncbi:uncharacterized protein A1O9_07749 [Exophiala aquamarina CBS 119918]|uniref:Holocytochrome c-type synthase n=1 Tax=Exophiala aquamarina CBS 119918 TaxID=1182545 RepID=A0A072PA75_9EURO|nr:uncharacterized protein A1O9_07749 [Exophiala aquamarina CBS 119918]KEF56168.1 hypothetical protein A1O9_07749 [Exophiala aquamarina CBS 119918]